MKIWIDAQLSPAIATWINLHYEDMEAHSVAALGLRDARDTEIFAAAREQNAVIMSKDDDFRTLARQHGPPPKIIWLTCGNTSNAKLQSILSKSLSKVRELLEQGEMIVEISDK